MRCVRSGMRSSLWVDDGAGRCMREYHDTGVCHELSYPPPERRRDAAFRGTPPAPPHLRRALAGLVRDPRDVQAYARLCGDVAVSTAWNYACRAVEQWPACHVHARRLVYPPVLRGVAELADRDGTLRDVLHRLDGTAALRGDVGWRCVRDRCAHVRLARLCLQAEEEHDAPPEIEKGKKKPSPSTQEERVR